MDAKILTISVEPLDEVKRRMKAAFRGKGDATARLTFTSAADMARILTPTRWALLEAMTGAGPLGVRELARRMARDVKGVHTDAHALALAGVIERLDDGKFSFPYRQVKVQFAWRAAA